MKAVLLEDSGANLPQDSIEYVDPNSQWTEFTSNVRSKTISVLLRTPLIGPWLNQNLTLKAGGSGTNRPYAYSCKSDYTSYESLIDYSYYGRHLKPATKEYMESLPEISKVLELFHRPVSKDGKGQDMEVQTMCPKSTLLFPTFAQHLIDSFIVTAVKEDTGRGTEFDWRRTDTPHDIGLLPLYGRTFEQTRQLRLLSEKLGERGRLKTQIINGEEWAPYLFDKIGRVKKEFDALDEPQGLDHILQMMPKGDQEKKKAMIFAFGGARTNLTPNISAWNTLLLREHNRIAGDVEKENPSWDDERVFQVARNVLLAIYLKLVIEEYINHITAYGVDFTVAPDKWMWNAEWYKRNWISAEFAVLYRWHAIIPNRVQWGKGTPSEMLESLFSNDLLLSEDHMNGSLRNIFVNISNHRATSMQLHNSEKWMVGRDQRALEQSRACELRSYADYCAYLGIDVPQSFADITKNGDLQAELKEIYGTVDKVEFWTGLIATDHPPEAIMSSAMTTFVANDAFNQALTHPILSEHVFTNGEETFSKVGFELVKKKQRIADMLQRNTNGGAPLDEFVGMTNPNYDIPLSKVTKKILLVVFAGVIPVAVSAIISGRGKQRMEFSWKKLWA